MLTFKPYGQYTVIIGDIVDSKSIEERTRQALQSKFKKVLAHINSKYASDIAAKFKITLGDEFQGLLKKRSSMLSIIDDIELALRPFELRFGVGIGHITTAINFEDSSEIDGSAYHRAREMIEKVEQEGRRYGERESSILISSGKENLPLDQLINSILSLCTVLKSRWTGRQREIIEGYLSNEENQYKAAAALNIGQSSVNKALNSAKFYSYSSAIKSAAYFLSLDEIKEK